MAFAQPTAGAAVDVGEWRRYWTVMIPAFVGVMMVSSHGHLTGVMIGPLEQEFGWPRAQISAGLTIMAVVAVLLSPFAGAAVDRFGPRRMALAGVPLYCGLVALMSLITQDIWTWFAIWGLMAFANLTVMPVTWLSMLNAHFRRNQGLALAIALSGTGLAGAIYPYLITQLIAAFGWRSAFLAFAALLFAAVYLPTLFLFRKSADAPTITAPPHAPAAEAIEGVASNQAAAIDSGADRATLRAKMASPRFLKLAGAAVLFAMAGGSITHNLVPMLIGEGLTAAGAAATAGLVGIGAVIGRIVGGYLLDRIDGNKVAAAATLIPIAPLAIILMTQDSVMWAAFACVVFGLSLGTELDACAFLAARHFGARYFGGLFGSINGLLIFGVGVAPPLANLAYDETGNYNLVYIVIMPVLVVTAMLFLSLGDYRHLDPETGEPLSELDPGAGRRPGLPP